jgi:hypothetical protein
MKKNLPSHNPVITNTPRKQELTKRSNSIIEIFNSMTDKLNLDPILETFKSNEILKEFYMKRIFEVINVKFIFYIY